MSAVLSADPQKYTHCKRCGFPFENPSTREICNVREACDRRLTHPTYRVPADRLAAIEVRVRTYLIERARNTSPGSPLQARITYTDLCKAIDPTQQYWASPRFRGIGKVLGRISSYEHENGRPLLSALVVQSGSYLPGNGFAGLGRDLGFQIQVGQERGFWRTQLEDVVRYWTGPEADTAASDPTAKALALLANISEQLQEVRHLLGAV